MRIMLLCALVLMLLERLYPAQQRPPARYWVARALLLSYAGWPLAQLGDHTWIPFFQEHRLVDLQNINPVLGGLLGFVTFNFFLYWWHRFKHTNQFLWRTLHQLHHSPRRIEVMTAYYGHPLDGLTNMIIVAFALWSLLGLHWTSVVWFGVLQGFYDYFSHSNLKTPYWIGYFIQRPEMHRVHHEYQVHRCNYSLPIWDMLFGTHVNPKKGEEVPACGFDEDKEMRIVDMLLCRDVHEEPKRGSSSNNIAAPGPVGPVKAQEHNS